VAGAEFLGHLDPGWWREGAMLPANLTALDMASPYRCVLAWWAAEHLAALPQRGPRQIPPYDRVVRVLRLSPRDAEALGFTGVDADLLTPRVATPDHLPAGLPRSRCGPGSGIREAIHMGFTIRKCHMNGCWLTCWQS
jgi:hypothetical protein